jgi:hypothetical protein
MLKGTPRDLTPFGTLLSAAGSLHWAFAAGALAFSYESPKLPCRPCSRSAMRFRVVGVLPVLGLGGTTSKQQRDALSFRSSYQLPEI